MSILNMMFDAGDNSKVSAQWEFLDTPPAVAWRDMLEYSIANPTDNPLHLTDAVFCSTKEQAVSLWSTIRNQLAEINHEFQKLPFGKLKPAHGTKLLRDLNKLLSEGKLGTLDRAYKVKAIMDSLKRVMFFLDNVQDNEFNNGNEGSSFGQIIHVPDPHFARKFDESWLQFTTMDIVPGTVYAELTYADMPWHNILRFGAVENAYEPVKLKRFGPPTMLGSGFMIPFGQDLGGVEAELIQYFYDHIGPLKYLDPDFDPVYALSCCGRIPVAKLKTKIGEAGYPGYDDLLRIESMFKLETYESY